MPSITSWTRLEPKGSEGDIAEGYAARIHDPLWLLARQWQLGEFRGEDVGSPIVARWRGWVAPATRYHAGPIPPNTQLNAGPFDPDVPLETQVERQPLRAATGARETDGLRFAVESGQHFLQLLALQTTQEDHGDTIRRAYLVQPLTPEQRAQLDPETTAFADLAAGRALDGRRLRAALGNPRNPRIDRGLGIRSDDIAEVEAACRAWIAWADELFSTPVAGESPWQPDRFEYAFSLSTRLGDDVFGERTLTAQKYDDGTLDWYSFDLNGEINMGTAGDPLGDVLTRTVIPAPVTFHGMPARRFWEFEDARIDLGALQPGATDLPQILLVETLTGYGNDWFVIPIDLPVGSLAETRSLVVTDTFGVRTLLRPTGDPAIAPRGGWSMFSMAMPETAGDQTGVAITNLFFLPSTLVRPLEGPVLEEVMLVRDELANLAWAIERRLESPLEVGLETARELLDLAPPPPAPREPPLYRLASPVPAHWIPLLPVQVAPGGAEVRLARGAALALDGTPHPIPAEARLLAGARLMIREEEVPREGIVVRRSYQAARWHDGRLFVWAGNRAAIGRGEASSSLAFDALEG